MAVPTHISSTGAQGGSITTNTNFYATTAADDVAVETMAVSGTGAVATVPSGWTEIRNTLDGTYRLVTAWKRCVLNEPNHAWLSITGSNRFILSTVIRGCPTSGDPWDVLTGASVASTTALSAALGTTVYSDCLYLAHIGSQGAATIASAADANLSSLTEVYDTSITGNSRHGYTGELAVAGAGGTLTGTLSTARLHIWMAIALKSTTSVLGSGNPRQLGLLGVGR